MSQYDKKLERYIKFVPPFYKAGVNTFVTALLKTLAQSDSDAELQIIEAGKQIFVQTAEGTYLDALGQNVGVQRPVELNLSDDKFRQLIPALSFKPKQIRKTMYDILDVFWGPIYSRANITSRAASPYNLGNILALTGTLSFTRNSFIVNGTGTSFLSELNPGDFVKFANHDNEFFAKIASIPSNTTLLLSTQYQGGTIVGFADSYSPLTLTLTVDGGVERNIILAPNLMVDTSAATAEEIVNTINAGANVARTTETIVASIIEDFINKKTFVNIRTNTPGSLGSLNVTNGTANNFAFGVQNGDSANFYISNAESASFSLGQNVKVGSEAVSEILTTITSITPDSPVPGITTVGVADDVSAYIFTDDCYIYKDGDLGLPSGEILITDLKQQTIIYELSQKELIVRIPSTVPALRRTLRGSIHPVAGMSGAITAIDNILKTVTVDLDLLGTTVDALINKKFSSQLHEFTVLNNTAGQTGVVLQFDLSSDLSGLSTVDGANGFVLLDSVYKGSFIFDPKGATFTATSRRCVLSQVLNKGSVFPSITVTGADDVPDEEGYLILSLGRGAEEQPIKYRGRPNNSTLLLDPSYVFEKNHSVGEILNVLVPTLKATIPRITGEDLAAYVTGTEAARIIVQQMLNDTKAAGITIKFIIDAPEYLWTTGREPAV